MKDLLACPPPPVDWVIDGVAARGTVSVLYGEPGVGKSYLALAFAGALAHGTDLGGFQCKRTGALLVDAENSEDELVRRMQSLGSFNGQVGIWFDVLEIEKGTSIADPGNIAYLQNEIRRTSAQLVILDSFSSLWPYGDENDRVQVTELFKLLNALARAYDTSILILHHSRRVGGYRGSGAIKAMSDIFMKMEKWRRDKDPTRRRVVWEKCRVGPEPLPHWVRFETNWGGMEIQKSTRPVNDELYPKDMEWDQ